MVLVLNLGRNTCHIIGLLGQSGEFWGNQEELCSGTRIQSYPNQASTYFHGAVDVLQGIVSTKTTEGYLGILVHHPVPILKFGVNVGVSGFQRLHFSEIKRNHPCVVKAIMGEEVFVNISRACR